MTENPKIVRNWISVDTMFYSSTTTIHNFSKEGRIKGKGEKESGKEKR